MSRDGWYGASVTRFIHMHVRAPDGLWQAVYLPIHCLVKAKHEAAEAASRAVVAAVPATAKQVTSGATPEPAAPLPAIEPRTADAAAAQAAAEAAATEETAADRREAVWQRQQAED